MQYEIELDGEDSERLAESLNRVINEANAVLQEHHEFPHLVDVFVSSLDFGLVALKRGKIGEKVTLGLVLLWGENSGTGWHSEGKSLSDALARVRPGDLVQAVICEAAAEARLVPSPEEREKKLRHEAERRAKTARIAAKRRVFSATPPERPFAQPA